MTPAEKVVAKAEREKWENLFADQLEKARIFFKRQQILVPGRKWAVDFYMPESCIVVEIEGGLWRGRHVSPSGFTEDCRKYNKLVALGYPVFRFVPEDVKNGKAIEIIYGYHFIGCR